MTQTGTPALPTGTVTFLFTDIEGSAQLAQQHPQAWEAARARHDVILRDAIARSHGFVFQVIGDAFCAAFATAQDALAAALGSQYALQTMNSTPGVTPETNPNSSIILRVRMGIHTGAAEARDGNYLGYLTLVLVQRVMSTAHGGQVLLSQTAYDLVHDSLPPALSLRDMGRHRLKGLVNLEHLWQLTALGLPDEFPPLQTLNAVPHNLPAQLTSFIGREREIAEVKQRLRTSRLLTLTGSGGTGKSRLAVQVASEELDAFADGVWFVELAPLSDPALVPSAVASALGVREEPGQTLLTTLSDHLRAKRLLLILDNCEHLIEACARFGDTLLHAARQLTLLATSREALGIAGEVAWRVPSLAVPEPEQFAGAGQWGASDRVPAHGQVAGAALQEYAAVRLFVERAALALATFTLTDANAPAIAQVCYRLDGIPLAIELAAARVRSLSVEQIAARLDNQFRLLTGGSRTALPRQQTLRSLIDWSYNLLSERERRFFNRLSVFAGGWTLEAAEAVCADVGQAGVLPQAIASADVGQESILPAAISSAAVLDLLDQLVNKSLVVVSDVGAETRYRLLETIRQYALEKLLASDQADATRGRHLDFFLQLAGPGEESLSGEELITLNRLEREHDNLRAALAWSLGDTSELAEDGLRLAAALEGFWFIRGYLHEGREWLEKALAHNPLHATSRPRALIRAGHLAWRQGDYPIARARTEEGTALWRERGDKAGLADGVHILGHVVLDQRQHSVARAYFSEALELYRALNNQNHVGVLTGDLGLVAYHEGNYALARSHFEDSLTLFKKIGSTSRISDALNRLGDLARPEGDYVQATTNYRESLARARVLSNPLFAASALHKLGQASCGVGDYPAAKTYFAESLTQQHKLGNKQGIAECLAGFAGLAFAQGEWTRAIQLFAVTQLQLDTSGAPLSPADRIPYERDLAAARAQVAEAEFKQAWDAGRALSKEAAIAMALDEKKAAIALVLDEKKV